MELTVNLEHKYLPGWPPPTNHLDHHRGLGMQKTTTKRLNIPRAKAHKNCLINYQRLLLFFFLWLSLWHIHNTSILIHPIQDSFWIAKNIHGHHPLRMASGWRELSTDQDWIELDSGGIPELRIQTYKMSWPECNRPLRNFGRRIRISLVSTELN